jgi:hypothetical protein
MTHGMRIKRPSSYWRLSTFPDQASGDWDRIAPFQSHLSTAHLFAWCSSSQSAGASLGVSLLMERQFEGRSLCSIPQLEPSSSFGRRACSNRPENDAPRPSMPTVPYLHMKLARHPGWNDFPENVFDFSAHRVFSHQPKEVFGMFLPMRNLNGKNVDRSVLEGVTPGFRNIVQIFPRDVHALSNGRSPLRSSEPIIK